MLLPGSAYDHTFGESLGAANRTIPSSTLLTIASVDVDAAQAAQTLASIRQHVPPQAAVCSAPVSPGAPVAARGVTGEGRQQDAATFKRIYQGIFPGKFQCCCDNNACPRGIRGFEKCGGLKCGGLGGRADVCMCGVGFDIPAAHIAKFHEAVKKVPSNIPCVLPKKLFVHSCHFDPAHLSFGAGGQRCQPPFNRLEVHHVPKWGIQVDLQALSRKHSTSAPGTQIHSVKTTPISAGYKRPRSSGGLAAAVKKPHIKATPEKHVSKCFAECPLFHNLWNKVDYAPQAAIAGVPERRISKADFLRKKYYSSLVFVPRL